MNKTMLDDNKAVVGIGTLGRFLCGNHNAIVAMASTKGLLGIGLLFVLSAALAREYDGADLLAEPWHVALPVVASLGTSFLLFCLLFGVAMLRGGWEVPFGPAYLRFLGLYWMTAPLAWVYARVNRDLKAGRIAVALGVMSAHERSDFPARWDPPPHVGFGENEPPILDVMEAMMGVEVPDWVRNLFTQKLGSTDHLRARYGPIDDDEVRRFVRVLVKLPEGPSFAARNEKCLESALDQNEQSEARRVDIRILLDLAKTYDLHPQDHFAGPQ